jgi:hypothetical protein
MNLHRLGVVAEELDRQLVFISDFDWSVCALICSWVSVVYFRISRSAAQSGSIPSAWAPTRPPIRFSVVHGLPSERHGSRGSTLDAGVGPVWVDRGGRTTSGTLSLSRLGA